MKMQQVVKRLGFLVIGAVTLSLLAVIVLSHKLPAMVMSGGWSMFQQNAQHTGRSTQIGPQSTTQIWHFPTTGVPGSPAIGSDGTIYLPTGMLNDDTTGYLYAINPDGTQKWQLPLTILPSSTAPAIGPDGTIYVHGNGAEANILAVEKLIAISPAGSVFWSFTFNNGNASLTSHVQSAPTIGGDGTIYIGSPDTNLYALNSNGTVKWARTPSLSGITASPALSLDGNTIYIVDSTTTLFAYSTAGALQWQYALSDSFIGMANDQSPSIGADGTIYVGSPDEHLYALNPNGTLRWRFQTGSRIRSTPAIGTDGAIYVGSDGLYAINPDGSQRWKFANSLFSSVSPIIGGDGLIYWRESFTAYAVNANGTEKWRLTVEPFSSGLDATPALGPTGTLYLPTAQYFTDGQNGLSAYAAAPPPPQVQLTFALDSQPDAAVNFRFDGNAPIRRFYLDDSTPQDTDAYSNSRTFTIKPGSYTITQTVPTGWFLHTISCTPGVNATIDLPYKRVSIQLNTGDEVVCTFTDQKAGLVRATLFHDRNSNGTRQSTEPWNVGWNVTLWDAQSVVVATGVTNSYGKVSFPNVRPGAYTLCETLQAGLTHPQPCQPLTVPPATTVQFTFANRTATVGTLDSNTPPAALATTIQHLMSVDDWTNDKEEAPLPTDTLWLDKEAAAVDVQLFLPLIQQ